MFFKKNQDQKRIINGSKTVLFADWSLTGGRPRTYFTSYDWLIPVFFQNPGLFQKSRHYLSKRTGALCFRCRKWPVGTPEGEY